MSRTLILSVDYPVPADKGSKQRTMSFVDYFSRRGAVDLMCYRQYSPAPLPEGPFGRVHLIDFPPVARGSLVRNIYEKLWQRKPSITTVYSDALVADIHATIRGGDYDAIVCRDVANAYPLLSLPPDLRARVIMDVDNIVTPSYYAAVHGKGRGLERLRRLIEQRVLLSYQRRCCSAFSRNVFCSETDRQIWARGAGNDGLFVVPNVAPPLELPDGYRLDGFSQRHRLLFIGSLSYGPNADGVLWFLDEIFPRLLQEYPGVTLVVGGRAPGPTLKARCSSARNVELVSSPADVRPLYDSSGIVIVPLRTGGGTSIKLLEAGLARRPVISTVVGVRGLGFVDRRDVLLFDDATSFLEAYRHSLDASIYEGLTTSLLAHVRNHYSSSAFDSAVDRALAQRA